MAKTKAPAGDDEYDRHREDMAGRSRSRSTKGRDIGDVPPIANVRRRANCRKSLRKFCETYNPEAFSLGWSADHLRVIARIEEAATLGALYAFAMPRGTGKTTLCRMAALWALSYAVCRYVFVIGANAEKAADTISALKTYIRFLPEYAADFPEVSHAAAALAGIANRASGQTCDGESTLIEWSGDRLVLPTVPPPPNWPKSWPLRADGKVPTAGGVVSAAGLTGDGIRGSLLTLTTGESIRPDLVLIDDPQTNESANSKTQNVTREQLVSADVLGMAGPGRQIAAVMPCTVIAPGDFIDRMLDRQKHPLWRGERTGILKSLPTDMEAWDVYFEVYRRCAQKEPPDFAEANAHYLANRAALDAGAEAAWPDRKLPGEASAVQHAMHLYCRDRRAFFAEYMNAPLDDSQTCDVLDCEAVARRVTNLGRGVVPHECTRLSAFFDVGQELLWYAVVAWDERFGGSVVSYGSWPEQRRTYFTAADARPTLADATGHQAVDAAVHAGLTSLAAAVLGAVYTQEETGLEFRVGKCLVDANWGQQTGTVYNWCRRSLHAGIILPSHGKFIGAAAAPMAAWQKLPQETVSKPGTPAWKITAARTGRRHVLFDTNGWKSFVAERLRTPPGAAGCLQLHAGDHRLLADHVTAEYPVAVTRASGGPRVNEWRDKPNRDNHIWDCLVGAAVAASIGGLDWDSGVAAGEPPRAPQPRRRVKLSELYAKKHGGSR